MSDNFNKLRKQAEEILKSKSLRTIQVKDKSDLSEVLQELDTYRIELEIQNEELKQTNQNLLRTEEALRHEVTIHYKHYDIAPVGYVTLNTRNVIVETNYTFAALLGLIKSEVTHHPFTDFIQDEDQDSFYFFRQRLTGTQQKQSCELRLKNKKNQISWVKLDAKLEKFHKDLNLYIAISDISYFKMMQDDLRLASLVFEKCPAAIMVVDTKGTIVKINSTFTVITGYTEQEAIGTSPRLLQSGKHKAIFYQNMWAEIKQNQYWEGEIWNRRKNGEIYPEWLAISQIKKIKDQEHYYIGIFSDITQRKEEEANIHFMAFYDPLTQLANRSLLQDHLSLALRQSKRNNSFGALLMLDLDHFKVINDSLGHLIGDELLKVVAERLKGCIREEDTIARMGGDEFIVLLADLSTEKAHTIKQANNVASKILSLLSQNINVSGYKLQVTASIGVVIFPSDANQITNLLKLADNAMYKAKNRGRNNFQFFTPSMQREADERLSIQNDLISSITNKTFEVYYQPQIDIKTNTIISAEALIRWKHPQKGQVSPLKFIPIAEESGLIIPLGTWVLEQTCKQIAIWNKTFQEHNIQHISVNVSSQQFQQQNFITDIERIVSESNINTIQLELELTETVLVQDLKETLKKLNALKSMGIRIAIDDFGKGYSSLEYIKRFPIDVLKIDQSFIRDITIDPSDAAIVQTIISLANNLDLLVIAEGVETEHQLDFLRHQGCDAYQGFYFSKAVPAYVFMQLFTD